MSLYECANCGYDYGDFPGIIMVINETPDKEKRHNNLLENKFYEIKENLDIDLYKATYDEMVKLWDEFYKWAGREHHLWFCCNECAMEYLLRHNKD